MIRRLVREVVEIRRNLEKLSREESRLSIGPQHERGRRAIAVSPALASILATRSKLLFRKIPIAIAKVERKLPRLNATKQCVMPPTDRVLTKLDSKNDFSADPTAGATDPVLSGSASHPPPEQGIAEPFKPESGLCSADALQMLLSLYVFEEHRLRFIAKTVREAERRIAASDNEIRIHRAAIARASRSREAKLDSSSPKMMEDFEWHQRRRATSLEHIEAIRSSVISRPYLSAKMWRSLTDANQLERFLSTGGFSFAVAVTAKLPRLCLMLLRESLRSGGAVNQSSPRFVASISRRTTPRVSEDERGVGMATKTKSRIVILKLLPRPAKAIDELAIGTLDVCSDTLLPWLVRCDPKLLVSAAPDLTEGFTALQQVGSALIVLLPPGERDKAQELRRVLVGLDLVLFRAASSVAGALVAMRPSSLSPLDAARLISSFSSLTIFDQPIGGSSTVTLLDFLVCRMIPSLSTNTLEVLMKKGRTTSVNAFLSRSHRSHLKRAKVSMVGGGPYKLSPVVEARIAHRKLKAALREARLQKVLEGGMVNFAQGTTFSQTFNIFVRIAKILPDVPSESHRRYIFACGYLAEVMTLQLAETKKSLLESISFGNTAALLLLCSSLMVQWRRSEPFEQLLSFSGLLLRSASEHISSRLDRISASGGNALAQENSEELDDEEEPIEGNEIAFQQPSQLPPSLAELSFISEAIAEMSFARARCAESLDAKSVALQMKQLLLSDKELWSQLSDKQKNCERISVISDMFAKLELLDAALSAVLLGGSFRDASKRSLVP
jgi:hypothetical protein